jgi:hypothetical protein
MSSLSSVESRDEVLLRSLRKYYADAGALRALTEVLRSTAKVSLRTLDWLVTNYAKKHNTVYHYNGKAVNVFLEYKGCLKAFSKRCFDPFQRRGRIEITDADGRPMQSTTGQLNFFRFAISMGVVRYAQQHATAIEADMLQAIRHRAAGKTPTAATAASSTTAETQKPKRKELSRAAVKTATATDIKVTVRFI